MCLHLHGLCGSPSGKKPFAHTHTLLTRARPPYILTHHPSFKQTPTSCARAPLTLSPIGTPIRTRLL